MIKIGLFLRWCGVGVSVFSNELLFCSQVCVAGSSEYRGKTTRRGQEGQDW